MPDYALKLQMAREEMRAVQARVIAKAITFAFRRLVQPALLDPGSLGMHEEKEARLVSCADAWQCPAQLYLRPRVRPRRPARAMMYDSIILAGGTTIIPERQWQGRALFGHDDPLGKVFRLASYLFALHHL